MEDIDEAIEPYLLFDLYDYRIVGKLGANGKGKITYSSQKGRNIADEHIDFDINKEVPFNFGKSTRYGNFEIDVRAFDRDNDAIESLIGRGLKGGIGQLYREKSGETASQRIQRYRRLSKRLPYQTAWGMPTLTGLKLDARDVYKIRLSILGTTR